MTEQSDQPEDSENTGAEPSRIEPPNILPTFEKGSTIRMGLDPIISNRKKTTHVLVPLFVAGFVFCLITRPTGTLTVLAVMFMLNLIVVMHEGAHYVAGKKSGMKITEFFAGFGPRIWSTQRGETEVGLKAIPAGGYVKIIGMTNVEHVEPEDEARAYRSMSYPRRLITTGAGIMSHFVLALILAFVYINLYGVPHDVRVEVGGLVKLNDGLLTPAQQVGLIKGDKIVSYDGIQATKWSEFGKFIGDHQDKPFDLVILRKGQTKHLQITPMDRVVAGEHVKDAFEPGAQEHGGFIGMIPRIASKKVSVAAAVPESFKDIYYRTSGITDAVSRVASANWVRQTYRLLIDSPKANDAYRFSSPVGITRVAGQAAENSFKDVLNLIILINISLGIFNLIPLPPFDGGHIAIATYERIRSRRGRRHFVDVRKIAPVMYAMVLLLVFVSLTAVYLDIVRPISNPFR